MISLHVPSTSYVVLQGTSIRQKYLNTIMDVVGVLLEQKLLCASLLQAIAHYTLRSLKVVVSTLNSKMCYMSSQQVEQ